MYFNPQKKEEKTVISLRIPVELLAIVEQESAESDLSRNEFIVQCIEYAMESLKEKSQIKEHSNVSDRFEELSRQLMQFLKECAPGYRTIITPDEAVLFTPTTYVFNRENQITSCDADDMFACLEGG